MIGKILDHYEILEKVGVGGMGEVYRARDVRLDRTVAVKILPPQFSKDLERRARFEREAKTISSLQHPNICTLHDLGRHEEVDYLVMEFIEGETLADRLKQGPLPPGETLRCGAEIAQALDRAHRSGIVHRDLKPGNIMLTKAGVKLLDFGLAKFGEGMGQAGAAVTQAVTEPKRMGSPGSAPSGPLTAEGTILGTFQYMAPEQLEGGEADTRSDIFALGSVLYEMATGRRAFEGRSQASLIAAILEREPAPLSAVVPMTPPALDHIVRKCLEKDPDDRWQSASDVSGQLRWVAESSSAAGIPAVVATRRRARSRLAWIVAAAASLGLVGMAFLWWTGRPSTPPVVRFHVAVPEGVEFVRSANVSPDGRKLAIGTRGSSEDRIWMRSLDDLTARPVPGTEGGDLGIWSSDSRHVAFFSNGKLRKVSVAGGPAQTVCDAPSGDAGTWSAQGVILFDGSFNDGIARVAAGGGTPAAAVAMDSTVAGRTFGWPTFLPDQRHFLFIEIDSEEYSLYWGDLQTGEKGRIAAIGSRVAYVEPGYLLHVTEETLVAQPFDAKRLEFTGEPIPLAEDIRVNNWGDATFSASRNGVLVYRPLGEDEEHLIWVDREGRVEEALGDPASYDGLSVAPDGRIVVERTSVSANNVDLWVLDPQRGTASRLTFDPQVDIDPIWTPDARHVIYSAQDEDGGWEIRRRTASGVGDAEALVHFDSFATIDDVTADGKTLILIAFRGETRQDILRFDLDGSSEPQPFLATPFGEGDADLSPDDRWIAYVSDESGRSEIYVRSFPDGESKWQVSTEGGDQPTWRADGKELFYISDDRRLLSVSVDGRDGLAIGTPQELFKLTWARAGGSEYEPAPDGQRFLFLRDLVETDPTPFTVVLNWTSELIR